MNGIAMTGLAGAALLLLAACGSSSSDEEKVAATPAEASWDDAAKTSGEPAPQAKGEEPGTAFALDVDRETGALKVALPGRRLEVDVPKDMLKMKDVDIDGTKLYPGSTVDSLNVKQAGTGEAENTRVRIGFTAPAAPDVVRAWFLSETAGKARPLTAAGDALVGATDEGKAYRITLAAAGAGRTVGEILVDE